MRYLLEVADNKIEFADEFFKSLSFVKKIATFQSNEITNPAVLKSISDYENNIIKPTPLNLEDLKKMINA